MVCRSNQTSRLASFRNFDRDVPQTLCLYVVKAQLVTKPGIVELSIDPASSWRDVHKSVMKLRKARASAAGVCYTDRILFVGFKPHRGEGPKWERFENRYSSFMIDLFMDMLIVVG